VLDEEKAAYHVGITHTTNKRFWEFDQDFRDRLKATRPQSIEMECATLFIAGYSHKLPLGALLLISDLPLNQDGIKTKKSSEHVFQTFTNDHVEKGVKIMKALDGALKTEAKGIFRGSRRRFESTLV
jgi:AMP nucleosidase